MRRSGLHPIRAVVLLVITALAVSSLTAITTSVGAQSQSAVAGIDGGLDLLSTRPGRTLAVGWVSTDSLAAPAIHVAVDGRTVSTSTPTQTRFDITQVTGGSGWGWRVRLDSQTRSSLCVSAVVDGVRYGLECWHPRGTTMLPAVGGGAIVGTTGRLITYSVEVEAATGLHPEDIARKVDAVLADDRSWAANEDARFQRVRPDRTDLRIILATPSTTDRLCLPFQTGGRLSCNKGDDLIVFNVNRWLGAVGHWTASLDEYRSYLVNHEVGHTLDFRHVECPGRGLPAPLMMQQTKSLGGCAPNGWPYPSEITCFGLPATIFATAGEPTRGSSANDVIVGTDGPDAIWGGGGDDRICGLGGADDVRGDAGRDQISGGPGPDKLRGGRGADLLLGNTGGDVLRGGSGRDTCDGGSGNNQVSGC